MTKRARITAIWQRGNRWFLRDDTGERYITDDVWMAGAATEANKHGTLMEIECGRGWWRPLRDITPVREGATL